MDFGALVDKTLPNQPAIGEKMLGLSREDMQKSDVCTREAQQRYESGKSSIAEFTSEMLSCAKTIQEAIYFSQISGAKIMQMTIRGLHDDLA